MLKVINPIDIQPPVPFDADIGDTVELGMIVVEAPELVNIGLVFERSEVIVDGTTTLLLSDTTAGIVEI